jgi:hypothetical protein
MKDIIMKEVKRLWFIKRISALAWPGNRSLQVIWVEKTTADSTGN